jgi:hypothetical protein
MGVDIMEFRVYNPNLGKLFNIMRWKVIGWEDTKG